MESTLTSSITRCRTHIDVNTTSGCSHFIARGRALVTFICNPATHVARNNLESVAANQAPENWAMKKHILVLLLLVIPVFAQNKKPTNLRDVLLAELKSTHNSEEWFVPANIAVKGLSPEQAKWTDGKGNHSVG